MVNHLTSCNTQRSDTVHWLALAVGVSIVLTAGVLYGSYSQRWGPTTDIVAAGLHLDSFPRQLGNWHLLDEVPMADSTLDMLECAGYVNRRYVNQEFGKTIHVAIIVGPAGPTAVHTPEICFSSRAYDLRGERRVVVIDAVSGAEHSFWSVDFKTRNVMADELRVYYSWSRGNSWKASSSPRFEFGAAPLLYKIQLAGSIAPDTKLDDSDPCREFLGVLLDSDWEINVN